MPVRRKYGDEVRVLPMGAGFSATLAPEYRSTRCIGLSDPNEAVSLGVRRIRGGAVQGALEMLWLEAEDRWQVRRAQGQRRTLLDKLAHAGAYRS